MQDKISAILLEADRDAALETLQTVHTEKLPFLVSLTAAERSKLAKMGPGSVDFVRRSVEMAVDGSDYLPGSFDSSQMVNDLATYDRLLPILQKVTKIYEMLEDTLTLIGNDLYVNSLEQPAPTLNHPAIRQACGVFCAQHRLGTGVGPSDLSAARRIEVARLILGRQPPFFGRQPPFK
jgi:hypothetical protein